MYVVYFLETIIIDIIIIYIVCFSLLDWVAANYPKPRTNTSEWLHKVLDRNVSRVQVLIENAIIQLVKTNLIV